MVSTRHVFECIPTHYSAGDHVTKLIAPKQGPATTKEISIIRLNWSPQRRAATVKSGNTFRDRDSDGVTNSLSRGRHLHLHLSVRIVSNISCFKRIEPLLVIRRTMTRLTSPVIIQQVWLVTQYRKIAKTCQYLQGQFWNFNQLERRVH